MPYLYIDPGTGSLVAQIVIAGVVAGWVFFKNFFRKLFFRKSTDSSESGVSESNP